MKKWLLVVVVILLAGVGSISKVHAQGCAVCTKTASQLGSKSARGLNGGIIYLATLPLVVLGTVGFIWWRRNGSEEII